MSTLLSGLAEYLDVLCVSGSGGEAPPRPALASVRFRLFSYVFRESFRFPESGCGPAMPRIRDFVYIGDISYPKHRHREDPSDPIPSDQGSSACMPNYPRRPF